MRSLSGSSLLEGDPAGRAAVQPSINVTVDKVSVWLPSISLYIVSALSANLGDLVQSVAKRSSEDDAIKAAEVRLRA